MNYYHTDVNRVWASKLVNIFYKFSDDLRRHNINLTVPEFEITSNDWGLYTGGDRPKISISKNLLDNFGLGAAEHVIGHEMAHMIVDRVFHMGDLESHGEAFKKACGLLTVSPQSLISSSELRTIDSTYNDRNRIVLKIKKLIKLSESPEGEEAEKALSKAHELMLRYNIKTLDDHKSDDYFIRPVGPHFRRMPNYVRDIAGLIQDFYFVNVICCYYGSDRYYEFFGNKENLDIAEYIFCCLLQQGESLWERYRDKKRAEHGRVKGIFSKANFIEGVVYGYSCQLNKKRISLQEKISEEQRHKTDLNFFNLGKMGKDSFSSDSHVCTALVWEGDKLMDEMYRKAYPRLRTYSYNRNGVGDGFCDGREAGKKLRISKGLGGSSTNSGKLLGC